MGNSFRVTFDGKWYRLQRYVRRWYMLWLGKAWTRVCSTSDGIEYGLFGYDNLRFSTKEEAVRYAEKIELDEQDSTRHEVPV